MTRLTWAAPCAVRVGPGGTIRSPLTLLVDISIRHVSHEEPISTAVAVVSGPDIGPAPRNLASDPFLAQDSNPPVRCAPDKPLPPAIGSDNLCRDASSPGHHNSSSLPPPHAASIRQFVAAALSQSHSPYVVAR